MQPARDDSSRNGKKREDSFDSVLLSNARCKSRAREHVCGHLNNPGPMNACSPRRHANYRDSFLVRNSAKMFVSRSEYNNLITSSPQPSRQIFARGGRPSSDWRKFVVDEQVGHER